jgi:hypothetical protein
MQPADHFICPEKIQIGKKSDFAQKSDFPPKILFWGGNGFC